jgi:hypothetical protein
MPASDAPPARTVRRELEPRLGDAAFCLHMVCAGCGNRAVAMIAQQELNKDAAAIRSPEEAQAAGATVGAFSAARSRPMARSRSHCSTIAACNPTRQVD